MSESEIILIGGAAGLIFLTLGGSLTALVLSIRGRKQGAWPVVGIVSSAFAMMLAVTGMGMLAMMFIS